MSIPTPTPSPATKIVTNAVTVDSAVTGITTTISSWHVNGWLLLGVVVLSNVVGVLFHF